MEEKKKIVSTNFVIEKIDHCKSERNKLMIARNLAIILISAAVFLADLGGHLNKNPFSLAAIILAYLYGSLAFLCITVQISYRIQKYTKYVNILEKYESKEFTKEEEAKLIRELMEMSENKILIIMLINMILYTAPLAMLLGLIYYFITFIH